MVNSVAIIPSKSSFFIRNGEAMKKGTVLNDLFVVLILTLLLCIKSWKISEENLIYRLWELQYCNSIYTVDFAMSTGCCVKAIILHVFRFYANNNYANLPQPIRPQLPTWTRIVFDTCIYTAWQPILPQRMSFQLVFLCFLISHVKT